jgi:predicted transcriptional regulator of viral defense system
VALRLRATLDGKDHPAQNVGMTEHRADESRRRIQYGAELAVRLRAAGLGAFFRPSQLACAGLTRHQLRALVRRGVVEHVARGLYRLADAEPTENYSLALASARVPNSVVCLLSALRVHGIGTQVPAEVWLAIPHKARRPRLPELRLRIVRFSGPAWTFEVRDTEFEGVPARITSAARTVVDCFRFERLLGREAAIEALDDGLRQRKVTVGELARVADVLRSRRLSAALDLRSI